MGIVWGARSPLKSEFSDGYDRVLFSVGGGAVAMQFGREVELDAGDAILLSGADRGAFVTLASGKIMTLEFPNGSIARLLQDPRNSCLQRIPGDAPGLRLLRTYLRSFVALGSGVTPPVLAFATAHIRDLVALAVGASSQTHAAASVRSLPAARLQSIRNDILGRLDDEITVDEIAARHSISPRYVRKLFERQGTTFTEFVRDERLDLARRRLLSSRSRELRIGEIAYSVGFNDLSYFNRAFRRRFGCSPREMRDSTLFENEWRPVRDA
jgi:AraC-like DNA-binding protein